jgi:hypothetical protein
MFLNLADLSKFNIELAELLENSKYIYKTLCECRDRVYYRELQETINRR